MVLTHSKKKDLKRKPVLIKEDNPKRLFMSKAEVLIENAKEKNKRRRLEEARVEIENESDDEAIQDAIDTMEKRIKLSNDDVFKKDARNQIKAFKEKLKEAKRAPEKDPDPYGDDKVLEEEQLPPKDEGIKDDDLYGEEDSLVMKEDTSGIRAEIKKLAGKYETLRGPGSKAKKEAIGEQIRKLEAQLPTDEQY